MNYVDRYIYAVTRSLPEKDKEEVGRELRANIEDMLDGDTSEANLIRVLEEMGRPRDLAASYAGRDNYLIGPAVYHTYIEVLKIVTVAAVVLGLVISIIDLLTKPQQISALSGVITMMASWFGTVVSVIIGFVFWITVLFVIIERTDSYDEIKGSMDKPFRVTDLKEVPVRGRKKISRLEMAITMVFTVFFLYLFVFRNDLIAVYLEGETPIRIFSAEAISRYRVMLLAGGLLSVLVSMVKLIYGRWSEEIAVLSVVDALVNLGITAVFVIREDIFTAGFIQFVNRILQEFNIEGAISLSHFHNFVLALVSVFTLIEIGSSLYYGLK